MVSQKVLSGEPYLRHFFGLIPFHYSLFLISAHNIIQTWSHIRQLIAIKRGRLWNTLQHYLLRSRSPALPRPPSTTASRWRWFGDLAVEITLALFVIRRCQDVKHGGIFVHRLQCVKVADVRCQHLMMNEWRLNKQDFFLQVGWRKMKEDEWMKYLVDSYEIRYRSPWVPSRRPFRQKQSLNTDRPITKTTPSEIFHLFVLFDTFMTKDNSSYATLKRKKSIMRSSSN